VLRLGGGWFKHMPMTLDQVQAGAPKSKLLSVMAAGVLTACAAADVPNFPTWAYPWDPNYKAPPPSTSPQHLPGSTAEFSQSQARDLFFSPDWHPDDHPPMPEVVAHGRKPDVLACGCCHRAEGPGGPENCSLAGLPAPYIVQQIADKALVRNPSARASLKCRRMWSNLNCATHALNSWRSCRQARWPGVRTSSKTAAGSPSPAINATDRI